MAAAYGIYQQLFGATAELPRQANPDLADFTGTVTFNENDVNAGLQVIDAAVSLIDSDSVNFNGGRLDLYYLTGQAAEDQLGVVHQGNGAGQIGVSGNTVSYGGTAFGTISGGGNGVNLRIDFTSDTATPDAVEALIQRLGYANSDSFSPNASRTLGLRVSDGDGGSSTANVLTINVTPQDDGGSAKAYGEEQVNTYTPSTQDMPAIASLSGGGYVVAWDSSAQDGAGDGVYAQRFTSGGVAIGPEFRVNTTTTGAQNDPTIVGLSNGGFVVAWTSPDASVTGIYAQRYDASGVAQGSEFLVNTASTSGTQTEPVVSAYAGGFVVGWSSNASLALGGDGSGYGIYGQHYLNDGTTNGASFRVNTTTLSDQSQSDVATSAAGGVVVWTSYNQDAASTNGIYAQRYAANGAPLGGEFMVNTLTAGNQVEPHVAMLSDGGFVVVWTDQSGVDGSSHGVYGQRYDSAGIAQGGQFLINESTTGGQYQPDVTGLSSGGFVVTWYNDNYDLTGAGTTSDVYIREYDATGNAIDGQRKLDSGSNSTEYQPAIADLGNGNFAVVYADYNTTANGGNNTYEIHQQLFGDTVELARPSANPVLDDVIATRTLGAAQAITPQLIDADVWVSDSDSADFGGGSLWVYFTSGQLALDVLGVNNEGTGAGCRSACPAATSAMAARHRRRGRRRRRRAAGDQFQHQCHPRGGAAADREPHLSVQRRQRAQRQPHRSLPPVRRRWRRFPARQHHRHHPGGQPGRRLEPHRPGNQRHPQRSRRPTGRGDGRERLRHPGRKPDYDADGVLRLQQRPPGRPALYPPSGYGRRASGRVRRRHQL
jgi:hypothetical protein